MPSLKKILPKLHKFLFPRYHNEQVFLADRYNAAVEEITRLTGVEGKLFGKELECKKLHDRLESVEKKPKPTMADLMRECLGVLPMDFTHVVESLSAEEETRLTPQEIAARNNEIGLPKDFLDTLDPVKRDTYIAQLYQIWNMEVFSLMCDHYTNLQGNWTLRKALDDMQVFAGRMSINGIYLIRNKVRAGHDEYKERSKPPEEFDEHEMDEGFDISNLTKKDK